MKKWCLVIFSLLVASAAEAACPAGSTCETFNGRYNYKVDGGTADRMDYQRWNDQGINILEFGADPTGIADSTAAIQAAIDFAFTHNPTGGVASNGQGVNSVFCPSGIYKVSYPIFFDPPGNMRGSAAAWSSGTTYAIDQVVTYLGIPWKSLSNGNINHTPTTGIGGATFWTPTTVDVTLFSYSAAFRAIDGLSSGGNKGPSCLLQLTYNNAPGFWSAAGNGVLVENLTVIGASPGASTGPGHRCGQPGTGIGIGVPGDGGGANRTKLVNVGVGNLYYGIVVSANTNSDGLGAENKIYEPLIFNTCLAITFYSLQNYMNHIVGGTICGQTGVFTNTSSQGILINGGHFSCEDSTNPSRSFAISSVSSSLTGHTVTVTATLALTGDTYMVRNCSTVAGCVGNVYNAWTLKTTGWGVIPLQLKSFNTSTNVATFDSWPSWNVVNHNFGLGAIDADISAQTKIYATELLTVLDGNGFVGNQLHIENASNISCIVPTRVINSFYGFGSNRPNVLTDVYFNYDPSGANSLGCLGSPPSDAVLAAFYAQGTFDFITVDNADLIINSYNGSNSDWLTASVGIAKFVWHNSTFNSPLLSTRPTDFFTQGSGYNFTSQYTYAGTHGFGYGYFDTLMPALTWNTGAAPNPSDAFRSSGWQQTPAWGNRPAPWATPCISPSQYAQLQAVPAITNTMPSNGTITAGTYNSGNGLVTLTVSGSQTGTERLVTISGATGTGSFASINGTFTVSGGSTITYTIATGLTMTITGGSVVYNWPTYTITYPLIFGSQQYRQCDWKLVPTAYAGGTTYAQGALVTSGGTTYYSLVGSNVGNTPASSPTFWAAFHYGFVSNHLGWSFGQNLTTTNVPGLAWSSKDGSGQIYIRDGSGRVPAFIFPGVAMTLTGTGGSGCPGTPATFVVTGVHRYLGYVDIINAGQDLGPPHYASWGSGNTCTGTTVAQPAYSFTNLN